MKLRLAVIFCMAVTAAAQAGGPTEERARKLTVVERRQLESFAAFSPEALRQVRELSSPQTIRKRTEEILALDNLSIGSRKTYDAQNRAAIHRYILGRIDALKPHGVESLGSLKGMVAVPVTLENRMQAELAPTPSRLIVGDKSWPVSPLWPNGAMPSLCPRDGLTGPLIHVGDGEWDDIKGLDLKGSIALMNYNGGRNWERLFSLGCQAVIVVEDDHVDRYNGERLFCDTPVPMPRFYVPRDIGRQMQELASRKQKDASGKESVTVGQACRLEGGAVYENRPWESIYAYLPPTEPLKYPVTAEDLLNRIAIENEVTVPQLLQANRLSSPVLSPGQVLTIPGRDKKYTVRDSDLLLRLAGDYGVDTAKLREANSLPAGDPRPGQVLTIPNLDNALMVMVPIDSVSVVPDQPHGTQVAANIATALTVMEHMATASPMVRRKGVVFMFLDAEQQGGQSSRTFAEYYLLNQGQLSSPFVESPEEKIAQYEKLSAWLADRSASLGDDDARWMADKWLRTRVDKYRVASAEARIEAIKSLRSLEEGADSERARFEKEQTQAENHLAWVVGLRDATLENSRFSWPQRVSSFFERLDKEKDSPEAVSLGISTALLTNRLNEELREEKLRHSLDANNREIVTKVLDKVYCGKPYKPPMAATCWYYSLSSGTPSMSLVQKSSKETYRVQGGTVPGGGNSEKLEKRFSNVVAFASVKAGWPEDWTIQIGGDEIDHPMTDTRQPPGHYDFWTVCGVAMIPLATAGDLLPMLDTPRDVPSNFDFANFALQARNVILLTCLGAESPLDSLPPDNVVPKKFSILGGKVVQANIRSGIDAQDPVPQAYVYYPGVKKDNGNDDNVSKNESTILGLRKATVAISLLNGSYRLPLEEMQYHVKDSLANVYAYHLDPVRAVFDKVLDEAQIGTQKQKPEFVLRAEEAVEKDLVVTSVYPLVFFTGFDPMGYAGIGDGKGATTFKVLDAVLNGEPAHYGLDNAGSKYSESNIDANILYMPPGRRARITAQDSQRYKLILCGSVTEKRPKGEGYYIGPRGKDRNLVLTLTPLHAAQDMGELARQRETIYRQRGIQDQSVQTALKRSQEKLQEALAAMGRRDWQSAVGASRESWGILIKYYPRILDLGRQAVFSAVLLMALLVPASTFLEKLLLGGKSIIARLIGSAALFIVGVVFLNYFHPAFEISVSPFIVMIAFVMILMSIVVMTISYQRFDVLLRRARAAGGEVESEEISLLSSLSTALSMGVSNLKKRPTRTALTIFTVTVLTFSIIAFVSVRGQDEVEVRQVSIDSDIEGVNVATEMPRYEGVLFREYFWGGQGKMMLSALRSEFGTRFRMTTRGYFIDTEGGNTMNREGVNQIVLHYKDKTHVLMALMTFEPAEVNFSHLNEAVSNSQWIRGADAKTGRPADRNVIILPDVAARALGITPEMLYENGRLRPDDQLPVVTMLNLPWRVIGILDVARADRMRDITGKSYAMVDYARSAISKNAAGTQLVSEPPSYHMSWRRLGIIPMDASADVEAQTRSTAILFDKDADQAAFYRDLVLRSSKTVFGTRDGKLYMISTQTQQDIGGLAKIVVPVILCILIVLNTMLANVEERKGEVAMLGAIGLSPAQISFLLLSESLVFSVLGIVFGVFAGQFLANAVRWIHQAGHPEFLSGLSFNFTSILSMGLAMGTGLVVLVATLIPARKAAALAAPSGMARWTLPVPDGRNIRFHLPFTLTRGNAVGMMEFFRRFLLNHSDAASTDFNCRNVRISVETGQRDALLTRTHMWLSPYDLDVAQEMEMRVTPTDTEGVFGVQLDLHRTSGTEEAWMRTNYGFLDLVRHQFLMWRNLDNTSRMNYIAEGAKLFQEAMR